MRMIFILAILLAIILIYFIARGIEYIKSKKAKNHNDCKIVRDPVPREHNAKCER